MSCCLREIFSTIKLLLGPNRAFKVKNNSLSMLIMVVFLDIGHKMKFVT